MIETMMILYLGYASFNLCYMVDLSGVLSAMVSGIVLAHYNFYNVSPIGKVAS
jgi:NhaP-type Na+/H+ or K+/H+ antiporter